MENKIKYILTCVLGFLFIGCASTQKPIYYWDSSYASSIYEYLQETGDINEQIAHLENLAQKAYKTGTKVPPGLYAHLGLLYSNLGDMQKARANFDTESSLFPESKTYMEFLKQQISNNSKKGVKK